MKQSRHDSRRDHTLRKPLEATLSSLVEDTPTLQKVVELVLSTLDEQNIISYTVRNKVNMLTPFGRIVCLLTSRPNLTIREMSVFLGVTESNIVKAIGKLNEDNLLVRQKVDGRYVYSVNVDNASVHPDIRGLVALIVSLAE